mmetsp:Transcript_67767/g.145028  ORF Transcript_67767/g.145028 Transcript_67767/m.145028 type:complete len:81 (+) Transcript_67767:305-547(+)
MPPESVRERNSRYDGQKDSNFERDEFAKFEWAFIDEVNFSRHLMIMSTSELRFALLSGRGDRSAVLVLMVSRIPDALATP